MNAARRLLRRARLRGALDAVLWILPWAIAAHWLAPPHNTNWIDAAALLVLVLSIVLVIRRRSERWLIRRLDDQRVEFEDSAALLFRHELPEGLAALQRRRLQARLSAIGLRELALPQQWRGQLCGALLALLVVLVASWIPFTTSSVETPAANSGVAPPAANRAARLIDTAVQLQPPAYTGLQESHSTTLDLRAVEGSRARWVLQFDPPPERVELVFLDGSLLPLQRFAADSSDSPEASPVRGGFAADMALTASTRYRLQFDGVLQNAELPAHRIDVTPDLAPQISVSAPGQTLTQIEQPGPLRFEAQASDDFGLGSASLLITLAKGDGELVEVSERRLALRGEGDARQQSFRHRFEPSDYGFGPGGDLILRLEVSDTRRPVAQVARSASYILRWPRSRDSGSEGMQGLVQRSLPAYFRSQRQIIIDSEALLAERAELSEERFVGRSDAIGVDQRLLRLRYGEFLGEEVEDAGNALPEGHSLDDGHGHADPGAFGNAQSLLEAFGHAHDTAEATTLFDPVTRERLRAALREMWQSELHLRSGDPAQALPYQHRALELIKQIQQATRIYLARVGLELPPIDFSRRGSGEPRNREPAPRDPLPTLQRGDESVARLWQALAPQGAAAAGRDAAMQAFGTWLDARPPADSLDLREAYDRLQREPNCADCAAALRAALWSTLVPPPQGPAARLSPDELGRAWLRALQQPQP